MTIKGMFLLMVALLISNNVFAKSADETLWIKDWRLEKPFLHGFIGVLTFNQVSLFPDSWTIANKNEPNALAIGSVEILEKNKVVPFYIGVVSGVISWLLVGISTYRQYKYRFVVKHFKKKMSEHYED